MENIKKEIKEIMEDYEISGVEILEENIKDLIEDYKDWRETIQECLDDDDCEGTWDSGEQAAQEDFLDWCYNNYGNNNNNNSIIKNFVDDEQEKLSYYDTLDIMYRIMSTLGSYYYYVYC